MSFSAHFHFQVIFFFGGGGISTFCIEKPVRRAVYVYELKNNYTQYFDS